MAAGLQTTAKQTLCVLLRWIRSRSGVNLLPLPVMTREQTCVRYRQSELIGWLDKQSYGSTSEYPR